VDVTGDRRLGHRQSARHGPDAQPPVREVLDDAAADWVRQRPERTVNHYANKALAWLQRVRVEQADLQAGMGGPA
jgi:hypothetical protein